MEIYLLGTRLFMIVEMPQGLEWDEVMSRLATLPKQTEWEALTAQYQQAEATATSDAKWKMMERIFHLYEHEADHSEYISEDICQKKKKKTPVFPCRFPVLVLLLHSWMPANTHSFAPTALTDRMPRFTS